MKEYDGHGTTELKTERLTLRRYRPDDAEALYRYLGTDPAMYQYSGWNPYATPEMAKETVNRFIDSYDDEHSGMVLQDVVTYFNEQWMDISANIAAMFIGDMTSEEVLQAIDEGRAQLAAAAGDEAWQ